MAFKLMARCWFPCCRSSERHNALYGSDFFGRLFNMCRHAEYAETARSSDPDGGTGVPTGRWVRDKIRPIRYDHMLKRCLRVVEPCAG